MDLVYEINTSVINGDADKVEELTRQALEQGVGVKTILNEGLISAMDVVGQRFESGELFIPEMLIAGNAMKRGLDILRPLFKESGIKPQGRVVIGTVAGDVHDIGKSLVAMMLESAGFRVVDLGVDVKPEQFVKSVKEEEAQLVGMSALLTTTMPAMKTTIDALEEAGLLDKVKTLIGGAPVTQDYADKIGADGYAPDAASAMKKAQQLAKAFEASG
jgi:5-methyltetrahydrofolate--homocysteine methyltransferase